MTSIALKEWCMAVRSGLLALLLANSTCLFAQTGDIGSKDAAASQPSSTIASANPGQSPTSNAKAWIVRDPATGRVFQQQLVPVAVPVTRWEPRTVEQTVYEPRLSTQVVQVPQTTYVPNTQYVMQPKVTGWWNPFKQPVQAYQYVPVTNWVPQTQQVPNPVTTQQWVPRQQKITVYQPVQTTETRHQLVQTELPQPQAPTALAAMPSRQPLFRLPILAQQRVLPWPARILLRTGCLRPGFLMLHSMQSAQIPDRWHRRPRWLRRNQRQHSLRQVHHRLMRQMGFVR